MLIKSCNKNWYSSINFVDKFDNFVGYDDSCQCCECFGWFFSAQPGIEDGTPDEAAVDYWWDTKQSAVSPDDFSIEAVYKDETSIVCFKAINTSGDVLWLTLYNCHNGYYSHGWEAPFLGEDGSL